MDRCPRPYPGRGLEPDQPRLGWRLDGEQTGWDLTFQITRMVQNADG